MDEISPTLHKWLCTTARRTDYDTLKAIPIRDAGWAAPTVTLAKDSHIFLVVNSTARMDNINFYPLSMITDVEWECPAEQVYLLKKYRMIFVEFPKRQSDPLSDGIYKTLGFFCEITQLENGELLL